jgi:hypothetical protein
MYKYIMCTEYLPQGVATKEDIDKTLKLGMAHPMGPLQLGQSLVTLLLIALIHYAADLYAHLIHSSLKCSNTSFIPALDLILASRFNKRCSMGLVTPSTGHRFCWAGWWMLGGLVRRVGRVSTSTIDSVNTPEQESLEGVVGVALEQALRGNAYVIWG